MKGREIQCHQNGSNRIYCNPTGDWAISSDIGHHCAVLPLPPVGGLLRVSQWATLGSNMLGYSRGIPLFDPADRNPFTFWCVSDRWSLWQSVSFPCRGTQCSCSAAPDQHDWQQPTDTNSSFLHYMLACEWALTKTVRVAHPTKTKLAAPVLGVCKWIRQKKTRRQGPAGAHHSESFRGYMPAIILLR